MSCHDNLSFSFSPGSECGARTERGKINARFDDETRKGKTFSAPHLSVSAGFGTLVTQVAVVSQGRSLHHS